MAFTLDFRHVLVTVFIVTLFTSPIASAGGISIHYGNLGYGVSVGHNQGHGLSIGHHKGRRALGHTRFRSHSSNHFSGHARHHRRNNRYYSYPSYGLYVYPGKQYYSPHYKQPYYGIRFFNSYQSHNYYPQTQPLSYESNYGNYTDAWETLAQGHTGIALNQFSSEAQSYPKAGIPKIGYSLSSAASGDLNQGVIAMRRAFRLDPDSLHYYHLDQRLQPMIDDLITKYQYSLSHSGRHKDEAFMVAALSYLKGDYTTAHQAIDLAGRDGDHSRSLKNLRDILNNMQISTRQ